MAAALRMQPTPVLTSPKAATCLITPPGGVSARQTPPLQRRPADEKSKSKMGAKGAKGVSCAGDLEGGHHFDKSCRDLSVNHQAVLSGFPLDRIDGSMDQVTDLPQSLQAATSRLRLKSRSRPPLAISTHGNNNNGSCAMRKDLKQRAA
eukprot:9492761-Pyramimonas_sp.AAC.1